MLRRSIGAIAKDNRRRRIVQWALLPVVIVTIAFGWWYPLLGFSVPVVMLMGVVGGLFSGRYVCGNLCPRGAFFDRLLRPFSRGAGIPPLLRSLWLRWLLFGVLMLFMGYRVLQNPGSLEHWGRVFWFMCAVTTAVGVILGVWFHQRAWCALCPMGTMQSALGGHRHRLCFDRERCITCRLCERRCPFQLPILQDAQGGSLANRDCLKCSECVVACPKQALCWPGRAAP